ncbi:hypothetical protein [Burkholderia sp. RF4-BP95]|uniref:hypothetical protein n=1 Tax=Burkholderia sp. RF4-BP95 TaxID=1637845 RepID=UPI000754BAA6|nr:hypothetical protein [Burkholderia sp. RF4-BP95]KUY70761.1 hypothetical protein WS46_31790 [Burkholderia sp. RF4-BP95]
MTEKEKVGMAADIEKWYRHILTPTEVELVDGEGVILHPKFFENKFKPAAGHRKWLYEISGRLLSKAGSVEDFAKDSLKKVKSGKKTFHGIIASDAQSIRKIRPVGCFDVAETPSHSDQAHADLISWSELQVQGVISAEATAGLREHFVLIAKDAGDFPKGGEPTVRPPVEVSAGG